MFSKCLQMIVEISKFSSKAMIATYGKLIKYAGIKAD